MSYLSAEIRALADHYGVDSVLRAAASILTGEAPPKAWAKKAAQQSPDKYRNECCPRCGTSVFDRATVIKAVQVDGLCEGDPVQVLNP